MSPNSSDRTLFLRTSHQIETNFRQIYLLQLFGLKYVELDSMNMIEEASKDKQVNIAEN